MTRREKSLQSMKNCSNEDIVDDLVKTLSDEDYNASVKIMVKDYADGWYELEVSNCTNVGALLEALRGRKSNA